MIATFVVMGLLLYRLIKTEIENKKLFAWVLLACLILSTAIFYGSWPVFFAPDMVIGLFAIWALIHMRQDISWLALVACCLLIYFLCFSPPPLDFEFDNRYLVSLKPFIYLLILYYASASKVGLNIRAMSMAWIVIYPILLIWNIFLSWLRNGYFMTRPNFIFENNFEVPFLLFCFIIVAFIYNNKDIRIYILVAIAVLLTGSRSGLGGLMAVSIFYVFTLDRKKMWVVLTAIACALIYLLAIRGSSALNISNLKSIDRLQNFYRIFAVYDFSFVEILKHPLGFGIYQKVPPGICEQFKEYAEWVTGNMYNCDPIMLQSFLARGLYQYGIYVMVFIVFAFFWELYRRMGWLLACVVMCPILTAAFSVGGFSNGLAFGGLLLCLLAYQQSLGQQSNNDFSTGKLA
ncbi:O-antigen ligase family protein [Polynucleobacter sp. 15G-AUS-farblos]|uniref:O-antigen ligase family protein n=1 Tax=Polynucleobacter sp. 15G-AUS-farblos TaxID=2689094 RepID=UPI001C0C3959|nr:O-antigen ligase family protein [Polynucleobacter sp. 15G-AUS-farblos]MBU3584116.1 O-antigen ligase family protein [Polynucleobacter sp. 15G-AUS-farblos]